MFCTKCGQPVPTGAAFCPACGTPVPETPVESDLNFTDPELAASPPTTSIPGDDLADPNLTVVRRRGPITDAGSTTVRADPASGFATCGNCGILLSPTETTSGSCSSCGVALVPAPPIGNSPGPDVENAEPIAEAPPSTNLDVGDALCTNCGTPLDPEAEACGTCRTPSGLTPESPPTTTPIGGASNHRLLLVGGIAAVFVALSAIAGVLIWTQGADAGSTASASPASADADSTATTTESTTTTAASTTTTAVAAPIAGDLASNGVFVESGSTADPASLEESVTVARSQGLELSVIALAAEPDGGATEYAQRTAANLDLPTLLVVAPGVLGGANQDPQFSPEEFTRARDLTPVGSSEDEAVASFVRLVLGGPDSVGVLEPLSARWLLLLSDNATKEFEFGDAGDVPIAGDWDCDGIATPGVWRPPTGDIFLRNSNDSGAANYSSAYAVDDAIPIAGDFDGDGCDTVSFYHSNDSLVRIFNTPEAAVTAADDSIPSDVDYIFGAPGDRPIVGDFNGDGVDTVGVFRPSNATFYLRNTLTEGPADVEFAFGAADDIPIAGDWADQDGVDSVAVYRPSTGTFFLRYANSAGPVDEEIEIAIVDALPIGGSFGLDRLD